MSKRPTKKAEAEHPIYDLSMGSVDYPAPTAVVIAGKVREAIVHCDSGVEAAYRHWDHIEDTKRLLREQEAKDRHEAEAQRRKEMK